MAEEAVRSRLEGFILRAVAMPARSPRRDPGVQRLPDDLILHWHADLDDCGPHIIRIDVIEPSPPAVRRAPGDSILHTVRVYPESVLSGLRRYLGKDD
jgi:hypothetical protein